MSSVLAVRDAMMQAFSLGQAAGQPSDSARPAAAGAAARAAAGAEQVGEQQGEEAMQEDSPQRPQQEEQPQQQSQGQAAGQEAAPLPAPPPPQPQQAQHGRPGAAAAAEEGAAAAGVEAGSGAGGGEAPSLRAGASVGGSRANDSVGGAGSSQIEEVRPASHGAINNPGGGCGGAGGAAWGLCRRREGAVGESPHLHVRGAYPCAALGSCGPRRRADPRARFRPPLDSGGALPAPLCPASRRAGCGPQGTRPYARPPSCPLHATPLALPHAAPPFSPSCPPAAALKLAREMTSPEDYTSYYQQTQVGGP